MGIFRTAAVMLLATLLGAYPTQHSEHGGGAMAAEAGEATREVPWTVTYHDGSGNGYRFWQDSEGDGVRFDYSPVVPETSSSGMYHGGEAKNGRVDDPHVEELWRWVRRLEADTALHASSRMMGTGAFSLKNASGTREFIVKNSPLLRELDAFLRQITNQTPGNTALPPPESWDGSFPIYPGAVQDRARSRKGKRDQTRSHVRIAVIARFQCGIAAHPRLRCFP